MVYLYERGSSWGSHWGFSWRGNSRQVCHFPKWKRCYLCQEKIRMFHTAIPNPQVWYNFRGISQILCELWWPYCKGKNHYVCRGLMSSENFQVVHYRYFSFLKGSNTCFQYLQCWFKLFHTQTSSSFSLSFSHESEKGNLRKHQLGFSWSYQYHTNVSVCHYFTYHDTK